MVELVAEIQPFRFALEEAHRHHPRGIGHRANRFVERGSRTGHLDADIRAETVGQRLDRFRRRAVHCIQREIRAQLFRHVQPRLVQIDCDHPCAAAPCHQRDDLPQRAESEDRDRITEPDFGIVDAVERNRTEMRENPEDRRCARRHQARTDIFLGRDVVRAVSPGSEDVRAKRDVAHQPADSDHLADFFVAEVGHRIRKGCLPACDENTLLGVPLFGQIRIRPPIKRQFGACADAGVQRLQAQFIGPERGIVIILISERVGCAQRQRRSHHRPGSSRSRSSSSNP